MKLTKKTILERLKKFKKIKWHKKPKVVKKNTLKRKLRAFDLKMDRRQRVPSAKPKTIDETMHICSNCGHKYVGRHCPQCGQAGTWQRYTFKQAILNFLDIWGLGNRPMFRTLKELFWRPGYMVRDYLDGRRQFYFPPFKLLALVIMLLLLISMIPGVQMESIFDWCKDTTIPEGKLSGVWLMMANWALSFGEFLSRNMLYEYLFISVVFVICIWIAFKPKSRYNLVETYIFLIFIQSQSLLLDVPSMLTAGLNHACETHLMSAASLVAPTMAIMTALSVLDWAILVFTLWLLVLSFKQFYELSWKSTIMWMFLAVIVGLWIAAVLVITLGYLHADLGSVAFIYAVLLLVLIPAAFLIARKYFNRNEALVPPRVITLAKIKMLLLLFLPIIGTTLYQQQVPVALSIMLFIAYTALVMGLSFLPIWLYKKYHRDWIAYSPSLIVLISFFLYLIIW